jgi:hypothetical protein
LEFRGLLDWSDLGTSTAKRSGTTEECMSNFVETWKGIAGALGRSERWCRYMARRAGDPLPVFKVGGIVRLNQEDLEDWIARQRATSMRPVITDDIGLRLIA